MKKNFYYIISGSLITLFAVLLTIFLCKKDYSDEYRLFYITKELKYYVPNNEIKNNYTINTICKYSKTGNYKNVGSEWNDIEDDGISTNNKQSNFFYHVGDIEQNNITINIKTSSLYNCSKIIHINNENTLCELKFNNSNYSSVDISSKYLINNKINKFSLCDINESSFKVSEIEVKWR